MLEGRRLLAGQISGQLWQDLNSNSIADAGELRLSGWCVYLDQNRDHVLSNNEVSTTTDASGAYAFPNLAAGSYFVSTVTPLGWQVLAPVEPGKTRSASR